MLTQGMFGLKKRQQEKKEEERNKNKKLKDFLSCSIRNKMKGMKIKKFIFLLFNCIKSKTKEKTCI